MSGLRKVYIVVAFILVLTLSGCALASEKIGEAIDASENESSGERDDKESETISDSGAALEEETGVSIEEVGAGVTEALLGIDSNTTDEIEVVVGDYDELTLYKYVETVHEYTDEYSIVLEYHSAGDIEEVVEYFDQLILNTEGYIKIQTPGMSDAMFQGFINGYIVYIEVTQDENYVLVVTYLDLSSKQ
ncbi:MAG: hypothetical protein PF505_03500 [Vallitaleaceae bacterium]|nr:hypothetical protein [Vallitaleaceae bacterium]